MPRSVHNDVLDGALNVIKSNCTRLTFCAGEPTTFAQATNLPSGSGKRLSDVTVSAASFSLSDGASGGRSLLTIPVTDVVDAAGTGDHIAFLDVANSKILYVATSSSQPVTAGQSFEFPQIEINLGDPIAL